eukprot:m.229755 g.229755  ORF g.229755 m.229755 type:complete len:116 (-) comp33564_c6_seq2:2104-2451(-)
MASDETDMASQPDVTLGLMSLFQPVVENIDRSVTEVQSAQNDLRTQIEALQTELNKFQGIPDMPEVVDSYVQKLAASRKKITTVHSLLGSTQERVLRLQTMVAKSQRLKDAELTK